MKLILMKKFSNSCYHNKLSQNIFFVISSLDILLFHIYQAYISKDIAGYSPAPGDLAYPDKLMMEVIQYGIFVQLKEKIHPLYIFRLAI